MPVLDARVVFSPQTGNRLDETLTIPDVQLFGIQAHLHRFPFESAVYRIDIVTDSDRRGGTYLDRKPFTGIQWLDR